VEGILVLHMEELRAHCNMLVYVDTGGGKSLVILQQCGVTPTSTETHCCVSSTLQHACLR
jgi:hypothetical protein